MDEEVSRVIFPPVHERSIADLATALAAFQAELPAIAKSETANVVSAKGRYSYTYASLGDISRVVEPLLGKQGLSYASMPTLNGDGRFVLRYMLLHASGESLGGEYPLNGNTPQEIGSSITYARRYTLCAVTGVAPDDDDDGAAASTPHATAAATYTPTPAEIRSVIATIGKNKGMDPTQISADFESWSQGTHIGTTEDVKLLGDYLEFLKGATS